MKTIIITFLLIFACTQTHSQYWFALGNGTNGIVNTIFIGGPSGPLYAGGNFTIAGNNSANSIARYDFSSWDPLGPGLITYAGEGPAFVSSLARAPWPDIYAGGNFSHAGSDTIHCIAKWDLFSWTPLGYGFNNPVRALLFTSNSLLIAGGDFTSLRWGNSVNYISQWNGSSWSPLGTGMNSNVYALTEYRGKVIAGGYFTTAGGITANHIAQWDGNSWSPLSSGLDGQVDALTVYNDELIAGGLFTTAGGVSGCNNIAKWNGNSWSQLGSGMNNEVYALHVMGNCMYAGGAFSYSGGVRTNNIAKWNGNSWDSLGSGTNGPVYSISDEFSNMMTYKLVIAGGYFTTVGGTSANHIAAWRSYDNQSYPRFGLNKPLAGHQNTHDTIKVDSVRFDNDNPSFYVSDITITIDTVNFPIDSDLEFYLIHQSVTDTIIYQAGGNGANFTGTNLNDFVSIPISNGTAPFTGSFRPYKPLSQFNNLDPSGDWILKIYDRGTGNTGTLEAWTLNISYGINPIGIIPISNNVPTNLALMQNYPNPFNPSTTIKFDVQKKSDIKLLIYDVTGRNIQTETKDNLNPGSYEYKWDGSNYASGIYFYRIIAGDYNITKKMVLVK